MDNNERISVSQVIVSGSSGLLGKKIVQALTAQGYGVRRLVRGKAKTEEEISWSPSSGEIDVEKLKGAFAVIHLAGESIASGRWTDERKRLIESSRLEGTGLIARTLAGLDNGPRVLISASAVGYYGDRSDEILTEESPVGHGFLARVCEGWEDATEAARNAGIRVARMRIGVVLSTEGGALGKMLTPFRLGMGGVIGKGNQYMSVIGIRDVVGAFVHVLGREDLSGPINVVSSRPVTNKEFTKILGKVLGRPTLFPVPPLMVKVVFGEMGPSLLLSSTRAIPKRLEASGYRFVQPDLESILRAELG